MSIRPSSSRRGSIAAASVAALAAVLIGAGGGIAAADPPSLDRPTCAGTLAQARTWPGTQGHGVRYVSDGYVSYLAGRPECTRDVTGR